MFVYLNPEDGKSSIKLDSSEEANELCEALKDLIEERSKPSRVDSSPNICIYCGKKRPCCAQEPEPGE